MKTYTPINLSSIININFPDNQYYKVETHKKQICLHHTASGKGIDGDFTHWLQDPKRIATPVIVGYDGKIFRCFDSKYWGHHLGIEHSVFKQHGITSENNDSLNKMCIGIEIDAWGAVVYHQGEYRTYTGSKVPKEEVISYTPGFKTIPDSLYFRSIGAVGKTAYFYHRYSDEQIYSVAQLLKLWCDGYGIPKTYREAMWNVSAYALSGEPGIWSHVSYRSDKSDCHPQPELIEMLKSIGQ